MSFKFTPKRELSLPAKADIGMLGEALVAQWLLSREWRLLQHRWRCRWGELDLVMLRQPPDVQPQGQIAIQFDQDRRDEQLVFIEVKVRSRGNWDANGLLAITPKKQAKLWKAAETFLAEHPDLCACPCRFDVALLQSRRSPLPSRSPEQSPAAPPSFLISPGSNPTGWTQIGPYKIRLEHYLKGAFEA